MSFRALALGAMIIGAGSAMAADLRPDQRAFRDLYKELVETNTTQSSGSCTQAAAQLAARLKAAGYPDSDLTLFSVPEFPKDGGLVAVLPGTDPAAKAVLLLAHLDVVEAKREDWVRDPFTLVEEDGKRYGRGTLDDKAQAAIWSDTLIRLRAEGVKPRRTLKMALTCGEEGGPFNGAAWLTQNKRALIDAEFALNEGGFGLLDGQGKPSAIVMEVGEKSYRDYQLEVTNPGGHSSRPVKENAIYRLARALTAIDGYVFPIQFTDSSRAYFTAIGRQQAAKGNRQVADAIAAMLKTPADLRAAELVAGFDPSWNGTLRTTCVATMIEGGHAQNALPQRARANINCRIFPGTSGEQVRAQLASVVKDPAVSVTMTTPEEPAPPVSPMTANIIEPVNRLLAEMWPGLPVLPILQAGATDGRYLNNAGIPTYGIDANFVDTEINHIHGLNEYVAVDSLMKDRDFLYRLVKGYIGS